MANKIHFGLKNVYYAVATLASDNSASYGTPVAFPGAVGLDLSAEGDQSNFYADDIVYYVSNVNNGYSGSLEMAEITDSFAEDVLGELKNSTTGLYWEDAEADPIHFALIFEFDGDDKKTRHILYNCVASRPSITGATKEESVEPQTVTIDITASSIYVPAVTGYVVKGRALEGSTAYTSFFTSVQTPTASTT